MTQPTDGAGASGPVDPAQSDVQGSDAARLASLPEDLGPSDAELVERIVDTRVLHRGRYLTFRVDTIERADGSRSERDIAGHPGAVAIVAIDADDRVVLVRQWRTPVGGILLELPAGGLDIDEATGLTEDPDKAAPRELEEETGLRARTWRKLTAFWSAPGFTSELMHLYVATDLEAAHPDERLGPDDDEHLRVEHRTFAEALEAVDRGEIADAKSIVGLLWIARERAAARADDRSSEPSMAASAMVRHTYRMTALERQLASAWVGRQSWAAQATAAFFAIVAVLAWSGDNTVGAVIFGILAIAMTTGFVAAPFLAYAFWRYRDRTLPELAVSIGPDGIEYRAATGTSIVRWADVRRIRETGRFLFISHDPVTYVLPKRILSESELAEVRRLAAAAGFGPHGRRRATGPRPTL